MNKFETTAAVLYETTKPLEVVNLKIPPLKTGQVLVELSYSGLCGTQLLEIRGQKGPDRYLPHTLGHEGSGIVLKTGPGVKKIKPKDRVILSWMRGAGKDVAGAEYIDDKSSVVHSGAVSTFMTRAIISENRLIKIPKNFPLKEAALLGCAIPTGGGIILNLLNPKKEDTLAIFGLGGIGLSALAVASSLKIKKIAVFDVINSKLRLAKKLGADFAINLKAQSLEKALKKINQSAGFSLVVEASGKKEAMENAFAATKAFGGLCVLSGNLPKGELISIDPFELVRGKKLIGSWGGQTNLDKDIPKYIKAFQAGKLPLASLISRVYTLNQINQAFSDLAKGKVARALLKLKP